MEIQPEELLYKLQQHKPLPQTQVLLLCGEEDYYHNSIVAAIPDYIFADTAAEDRSITSFDKDTNLAELAAAINSYPFFCGRSLVLLRDEALWSSRASEGQGEGSAAEPANKKLEQLTQLVSDVPDYCLLVICAKKLDKRTKLYKELKKGALICSCDRLKTKDIPEWLQQQAELYGARFTGEAIGMILTYLDTVKEDIPLGLLQQEVEKLAMYAGRRREWTQQDVLDIFAPLPNSSTFAITNAIMSGKLQETLEILATERNHGTYILPLAAMVAAKLRQVLRYLELKRQGLDQKSIMDGIGVKNPYAYKFLVQDSRRFSEERVKQALLAIADMNSAIRRGGRGYDRLEEILLQLLC